MMMTEVAGMGAEIPTSPGAKGKQAFNLMRQHSEDAVMTTFINNNNNNNTLEVDRSSPFSNHSGSNRSQDKTGVSQLAMQMQVEEEEEVHRRHEDVEIDKRNYQHGGGNLGDNATESAAKKVNSPPKERQKSGEDAEYEMREEESEDLSISHNRKEELSYQQQLQQRQQSNLNSISEEDRARSRGGAEGGEEDEGMMVMDEEDYSDDGGEMPGDEGDSDKDEHRITVREALMSRAYQAAAAAAKYGHGGSRYSHSQGGRPSSAGSPSNSPLNGHSHSRSHGGHHREHHQNRDHHTHLHHQGRQNYPSSGHHHTQLSRMSYLGNDVEGFVKAERRSHPSSPVNCDLKPESLGGDNGIGNALLSHLASLGGLAALQQSIPNFNWANVVGHNNAPLNLTHPNARDLPHHLSSSSSHRNSPHNGNAPGNLNNAPSNLPLSPNSLIASAIANITGGSGGNIPMPQGQGSIPQLILASGQMSQGIQGAQLLIPTSQGIMSQTVLTIPITQPGSPTSALNPSTPSQLLHHPNAVPIPSTNGGTLIGQGGGKRHHQQLPVGGMSMSHRSMTHHPQSPSIASAAPQRSRESASPDYPQERARTLLSMGSHLVGQPMVGHMPTIPEKLALDHRNGSLNGVRNIHGKRERESMTISGSLLCPPKSSPCSTGDSIHEYHDHDSDKFSDTEDDQMVDGINLDEIKEFAKAFKLRRLSLGLTQTQVGQALSITEGPAYSQSAICSALAWQLAQSQSYPPSIHQQSMFEKLDITPKSAQKIKPVLERWMKEAEERYKNGHQNLNDFVGMEPSKKRKRRTSFTPQALEILNQHFATNTHPSGAEITTLAHQLGYEREVIRIWFCNKRQALKNTVRMMSK